MAVMHEKPVRILTLDKALGIHQRISEHIEDHSWMHGLRPEDSDFEPYLQRWTKLPWRQQVRTIRAAGSELGLANKKKLERMLQTPGALEKTLKKMFTDKD